MNSGFKNLKVGNVFLLIIFLGVVGYLIFKPFFNFGFRGDDWVHFYNLKWYGQHNLLGLKTFISAYGGEALFMYSLQNIFGYEPFYYYFISFILKLLSSVSLFFLGFYLTRSRIAGVVASLLNIVSFAGVQSTDWVQNSNNYLALFFLVIGILFLFIYYEKSGGKKLSSLYFLSVAFLLLSLLTAVVRMHGLIFLYIFIEFVFILTRITGLKLSLLRIFLFISIVFLLVKVGVFGSSSDTLVWLGNSYSSLRADKDGLLFAFLKAILYPFITIGGIPISPGLLSFFSEMSFFRSLLSLFLLNSAKKVFLLFSLPFLVSIFLNKLIKGKTFFFILILGIWLIFIYVAKMAFPHSNINFNILLLGELFMILFSLMLCVWVSQRLNRGVLARLVILTFAPFSFVLIPHLIAPYTPIGSPSRHLTIPESFFYLFLVYIGWLVHKLVKKEFPNNFNLPRFIKMSYLLLIAVLMVGNVRSIDTFLTNSKYYRERQVADEAWSVIGPEISKYKGKRVILYFEYDDESFFYNSILWGGDYRSAVITNQIDHNLVPMILTSKNEVALALSEWEKFREKYNLGDVPIDQVVAFSIKDREVEVITDLDF